MDRSPCRTGGIALLPPAAPGWPSPAPRTGDEADTALADHEAAALLRRIRAETLFWPAPRSGAARPRALALDTAAHAAARASFDDADVVLTGDPAAIDPERLERVFGPPDAMALWARLGGIPSAETRDPAALVARGRGRSPWTGAPLPMDEAVEAQAFLRTAALRARGPATLVGMSAWKRRCLRPFFTGPDGPPRAARRLADATAPVVVWGAAEAPEDALRVEDGFVRSVGLGLRHTPPVSLTIAAAPPYFDATRRTAFEDDVATATFDAPLLARARRLRADLLALRLTKYNLPDAAPPPAPPHGRQALLAPGQVAGDASIRLGARAVRDDLGLLRAARARFPDAFILYKPHPDVVTGLRCGAAPPEAVAALADRMETRASAAQCLDWADRVVTITSLTGFEALLRGKAVTTFGRPFYAGWGLTDDSDPPPRDQTLDLDALTAAALILHPRYIDPFSGLPAPPEVALAALARQRAAAGGVAAQFTRAWRDAVSWVLNRM